jgi:hypothetical protein
VSLWEVARWSCTHIMIRFCLMMRIYAVDIQIGHCLDILLPPQAVPLSSVLEYPFLQQSDVKCRVMIDMTPIR